MVCLSAKAKDILGKTAEDIYFELIQFRAGVFPCQTNMDAVSRSEPERRKRMI
jgi:hypothetical protein